MKRDSLGSINNVRILCEQVIEKCIKENRWFSFCTKLDENQFDIMSLMVDEESGKKVGNIIADAYPNMNYRSAIFKYLINNYLCYVEIPKWGRNGPTFDKFLVTNNLYTASDWCGIDVDELSEKYSDFLESCEDDDDSGVMPYLKMSKNTAGERKITKPRKPLDLEQNGIRVVPLFALNLGVDTLYEHGKNGCIKVIFMKDSGQEREMVTCFNPEIIEGIYGDSNNLRDWIGGIYDGDFVGNKSIDRGYIRVFEVGTCRYENPLRSINYARILKYELDVEPDLTFLDINIGSAQEAFTSAAIKAGEGGAEKLWEALKLFELDKYGSPISISLDGIIDWVNGCSIKYSTMFLRELALAMVAQPDLFGWSGEEI